MKSAIAIVVTMAALFTGGMARAETDSGSTTAGQRGRTSGVSLADQANGSLSCEVQYTACLNHGGSARKCNTVLNSCLLDLLDKWNTQQSNGGENDGDGVANKEDLDDDRDGISSESEAVLVEEEPMTWTCVNPPCSPWDTQSTSR